MYIVQEVIGGVAYEPSIFKSFEKSKIFYLDKLKEYNIEIPTSISSKSIDEILDYINANDLFKYNDIYWWEIKFIDG